ncbi:MAG: DsrE/DsrF/DrsH-like family protein, partial [Eubacteriales bacterium]|nr:DsrE/DsrF/DrsH-like family protein [Eubacteriales bacterium]
LHLGDGVSSFNDKENGVEIELKSGKKIVVDLVILSIGVRPNSELAKNAGLEINARGGVAVDAYMRTSDPDIYAVGDVIEVEDYIFKEPTMVPLAGPANKQGRIAANNIAGEEEKYEGTQGTSIAKVFDLAVASTGANEKTLIRRGLAKGKDYESVIITQNSHAGYYPGATPMILKLLFSTDGQKIYGAQIVGRDGIDKRIDTIATTIRLEGGVSALKNLELAYAPPYSSAKDPVNMAGFTAENVIKGFVKFSDWDVIEKNPNALLLDMREPAEAMTYPIPNTVNIAQGELRARLGELDKTKDIVILCGIGVRSYNSARVLMQNGFENVYVYPAGIRFYRSTHYKNEMQDSEKAAMVSGSGEPVAQANTSITLSLDCSGMQCPGPIMKVFEGMNGLKDGNVMEVSASDPGFMSDIEAWCRRTGNALLKKEKRGSEYVALLRKGLGGNAVTESAPTSPAASPDGKTIIVFSGDLDKVLASFIIANGAAAMGRPVTMFFTFWGLTALRKEGKQHIKKTPMEAMFGMMLPRGTKKLKISKMNMAGMGTAMMKKIMNDKNVDSLEMLIKKALDAGIKIVACTMSMDVMGIKPEELIEGVTLGGVGAYLGDAEESNVNLFI